MDVFYSSPWVPVEWIEGHGHSPRGVWRSVDGLSFALPEGVCAFAQTLVALAKAQSKAAVILTTACDQMRRAADTVASLPGTRVFLFNLPVTWQTATARRLYHAEVERLGKFLVGLGGQEPTLASLRAVINRHDERRTQLYAVLRQSPTRCGVEAMANFSYAGPAPSPPTTPAAASPVGVPLALVGGPLLSSQWGLFDDIESCGGRVVLNATEPGERCLLPPLPDLAASVTPLALLADHYFDHAVDVFHRPNSRLYAWLAARLTERGARGIVLWVHVGCDLWRAEAASLRESFGLPVLMLDTHEVRAGGLRDTNRLAAFIESLQ